MQECVLITGGCGLTWIVANAFIIGRMRKSWMMSPSMTTEYPLERASSLHVCMFVVREFNTLGSWEWDLY